MFLSSRHQLNIVEAELSTINCCASELIFGATAATGGRVKFLDGYVIFSENNALLFSPKKGKSSCSKHNLCLNLQSCASFGKL